MKKIITGALAALTIGGLALGAAAPASARDWDHREHGGGGAAVAAGLAGLAVGAAIAGDHGGYYAPGPVYYDEPGYYAPGYYARPAYYGYYGRCHLRWRWDPYWGRYVRVRACY